MSIFKGFQAPTQHTQVPNEFFDEILLVKGVTLSEVKILGFMIRYTFGWQRAGNTLPLTFTEIMNATKQAREAVNNGLKKCLEKGYIQRKKVDDHYLYRLKIADYEDYPWTLSFAWQNVHPEREEVSEVKRVRNSDDDNVFDGEFDNRTDASSEIEPMPVRKSNRYQFGNRTDKKVASLEALSENVPLNKGLNKGLNKSLNKENLSIKDEVDLLKLPSVVISVLKEQIDRLKSSYLPIIVLKFNVYKDFLTAEKFADILNNVLNQNINISFVNYLDRSINTYITNSSKLASRSNRKPLRTEKLPEWFSEQNKEIEIENDQTADFDYQETLNDVVANTFYSSMSMEELLETKSFHEELGQDIPSELISAMKNKG
jgi:hypothetical protein